MVGKSSKLGMFVHAPRQGSVSLSVYMDGIKKVRKKGQSETHVGHIDEQIDLEEPTSVLDQVYFGVNAARMQAKFANRAKKSWFARIVDLRRYCQTLNWLGENPYTYRRLVIRRGRAYEEICGKILRLGRKENLGIFQSLHSVHGWAPIQSWWIGNSWRIVKSLLTNRPECFYLGRIGRPDI